VSIQVEQTPREAESLCVLISSFSIN